MNRAVAASVAVAVVACGSGPDASTGGTGVAIGRAVIATVEAAQSVRAPWRCALPRGAGAAAAPLRGWRRDGERVTAEPARPRLTLAAVAQARGAAIDLRAALRAANVDVVVAVGGMGGNAGESKAALAALVDPAWLVVAVPGDSEDWPGHAVEIADLAASGAAIVDGATVRLVDAGAAVVATLPGERWRERLGAGDDGCVHDDDDLAHVIAMLTTAAVDRPRVLVTAPAPQGGPSDLAPGGLHAGEPTLAAAVAAAELELVVHAPVDGTPAAPGSVRRGMPVALAAGSLDPVPRRDVDGRTLATGALVVTIDGRGIGWRFVRADGTR